MKDLKTQNNKTESNKNIYTLSQNTSLDFEKLILWLFMLIRI